MSEALQLFEQMKAFIGFTDADAQNLRELGPIFAKHGPAITDRFYETLGRFPETAAMIEGRVDHLKATHGRWMAGLFAGDYGEAYLTERQRIGLAHVRVRLDPFWVEGVMNILRAEGMKAIAKEIADPNRACELSASFVRVLDLDLFIIGSTYADERLDRLTRFTGMKRTLIENAIRMGGRKTASA